MTQAYDLLTLSNHLTHAYDCTASEADTTLPSTYYHYYHCHQAPDNCHQVLGCLQIKHPLRL